MDQYIQEVGEVSFEQLMKASCTQYQISLKHLSSWMLYRTAIAAYLTKLVKDEQVMLYIEDFQLMIKDAFGKENIK